MTSSTIASPFADLDREQLAVLLREWLLHGHLQDRVGVPLLFQFGVNREGTQDVAIDEWMAASPIYSVRTQELLGFCGDTVDVILKNLQFDVGSPPQYMDFRLLHIDDHHAEFWLDHCGALMDVEPMGDEWVRGMCHTIEDPTFDATALATNPRAAVRPIHRPPRVPADRMPHCHWTITIDESHATPEPHPNLEIVRASLVAQAPVPSIAPEPGDDGRTDYSGPVDPDLRFEDLSREALLALLSEVARQSHILFRSYLLSVTQRVGDAAAAEVGPRVLTGVGPVTAGRLVAAFGIADDLEGIARVLLLHPTFGPRGYVEPTVTVAEDRLRFALAPSDVFAEGDGLHWLAGLEEPSDRAVDAIVRAVQPRARAVPVPPEPDEHVAYEITIDPDAAPRPEEPETSLARFSTAATFRFR
ncbi:MAG: hypothetical protein ACXVJ7_01455 [Acidimicrobiia bacterium]